jgi:hypothetical protein
VFGYVADVALAYGCNPLELWNGAELWQVFEMARVASASHKIEIREWVNVYHGDPVKLIQHLDAVERPKAEGLAIVAEMMGNDRAAAEIRRAELARKLLGQSNGR